MADPQEWGAVPVAEAPPQPPAPDPTAWGAQPVEQPPEREGGIMQTVPQAIGMLGSAEGRSRLLSGLEQFPADFIKGTLDFFKTPGKAIQEGVTPEEETGFALNAALMTIGGRGNIPRVVSDAATPVVKAFEQEVATPAAGTMISNVQQTAEQIGERLGGVSHLQPIITKLARTYMEEGPEAGRAQLEEMAQSAPGTSGFYDEVRTPGFLDSLDRRIAQATTSAVPDLQQARELGVVGQEPPRGVTVDAARQRAIAATRSPDDVLQGPTPDEGDPWKQRFEQFVSKIDKPSDVQQLIRDAARDNGDFLPARAGDISLAQQEALAAEAGVASAEINVRGVGRLLKNDAEVRTAMQTMLTTTENVRDLARAVKADDSPENLIKLQESLMRRDLAVEQIVGLRAEWGRTGNVFQEFLKNVKDQETLTDFLKSKGRSADDLRNLADGLDALDHDGAARFLSDARTPDFWDKFLFYWTNALISGPITHTGYVMANAAFAGYESAVVTPIAGAIGAARRVVGLGSTDRVMMGETAARVWGLMAGVPDALRASWTAARHNIQTPLPGEVARNINPVINQKPNPIGGVAGAVIGIPSRGAAGIHSFFNFLGYRAELEAQAYRMAAKEGAPTADSFWQRYRATVAQPTPKMMDDATAAGYRMTFISNLESDFATKFQALVNVRVGGTQPFRLIFPFIHIPMNLLKRSVEQTPLALLDSDVRAAIKAGGAAGDTAIARMVGGSLIGGYAVYLAANDLITGSGPTAPAERQQWLLTHQPNSVRIGSNWVSYSRFGPIGDLLGVAANLAEVGPYVDDKRYADAAAHVAKGASQLVLDEVGMQGLVNVIEAATDPDRKGARFLSNFAGTMIPFSSANRQVASFQDPYMRDAKTFVDQLKQFVPGERQTVAPKRDFLGDPIPNTGYGTILRTGPAISDPLRAEMQRLQITPSPPRAVIGGVKLNPQQYDEYQATAGPYAKALLEGMVNSPGWSQLPDVAREKSIRAILEAAHKQAAGVMQMAHPELIQQGLQQRQDYIEGKTHSPRKALALP